MVYLGSKGNVKNEIQTALNLPHNEDILKQGFKELISRVETVSFNVLFFYALSNYILLCAHMYTQTHNIEYLILNLNFEFPYRLLYK